ncbi:hypothetical protein KIPB_011510, partial [Kipferlia bialata]
PVLTPLVVPLTVSDSIILTPLDTSKAGTLLSLVQKEREREIEQGVEREHTLSERLPWLSSIHTLEDAVSYIEDTPSRRHVEGGGPGDWLIVVTPSGSDTQTHTDTAVGVIGVSSVSLDKKCAELGYWLGLGSEGHGYVTQCGQAVVEHLFRQNISRIEVHVSFENVRSRAVPERLGFRQLDVSEEMCGCSQGKWAVYGIDRDNRG